MHLVVRTYSIPSAPERLDYCLKLLWPCVVVLYTTRMGAASVDDIKPPFSLRGVHVCPGGEARKEKEEPSKLGVGKKERESFSHVQSFE